MRKRRTAHPRGCVFNRGLDIQGKEQRKIRKMALLKRRFGESWRSVRFLCELANRVQPTELEHSEHTELEHALSALLNLEHTALEHTLSTLLTLEHTQLEHTLGTLTNRYAWRSVRFLCTLTNILRLKSCPCTARQLPTRLFSNQRRVLHPIQYKRVLEYLCRYGIR